MWNPFLTAEERASIRRGGELMRQSNPLAYWLAQSFIIFCATGCVATFAFLILVGAYVDTLVMSLFWVGAYIASSWLAARNIRRLP